MSECIIICEKPTQAANIRDALGDRFGPVYPAQGHLYTLADPEVYKPEWKLWEGFQLLHPREFQKVPIKSVDSARNQQLEQKRNAIAAAIKGARRVIIATDCDREGQVIGTEIVDALGFRGEVLRAMFTSEDPVSLREAFSALKPNDHYRALYHAGLARERADQVYNLSLTRAATTALVVKGARAVIGIGRVRTPTLAIVCIREIAIQQFKPTTSFGVTATVESNGQQLALTWHPADPPVTDRDAGIATVSAVIGKTGKISVKTERKRRAGPKPPDMSTLQEIAGAWGWPASKVMEVTQALYDNHKLVTYPRAETRYLPEALIPAANEIFDALRAFGPWSDAAQTAEAIIRKGKQGVFSDAGLGGESHHAIIPNPKTLESLEHTYGALSPDERRLFEVIARLFLQSMSPDYQYDETSVALALGDETYSTKGNVPVSQGWRVFRAPATQEKAEPVELPQLEHGASATIVAAELAERTTRAPERYDDGSLIKAMKNAAQFIRDPALRERLKDAKGIGTQATRHVVIEGLKDQGLILTKKGKLYPTQAGMTLFTTLHRIAPSLADPGTTALWESRLDGILSNNTSLDAFVDEVAAETGRLIEILRSCEPTPAFGIPAPTDKMVRAARAVAKRVRIQLPRDVETSFAACKAFLDAHPNNAVSAQVDRSAK